MHRQYLWGSFLYELFELHTRPLGRVTQQKRKAVDYRLLKLPLHLSRFNYRAPGEAWLFNHPSEAIKPSGCLSEDSPGSKMGRAVFGTATASPVIASQIIGRKEPQ